MSQLSGTRLGRGWLEDCIVHSAAGVPRSLGGRPVTVQGGSSRGAITRGFGCCSVYCVLSRGGLPSLGC